MKIHTYQEERKQTNQLWKSKKNFFLSSAEKNISKNYKRNAMGNQMKEYPPDTKKKLQKLKGGGVKIYKTKLTKNKQHKFTRRHRMTQKLNLYTKQNII